MLRIQPMGTPKNDSLDPHEQDSHIDWSSLINNKTTTSLEDLMWGKQAQVPAPAQNQTAQDITKGFEALGKGIQESGNTKIQEYARRIQNGESKESVLQGLGPVMRSKIEQALQSGGTAMGGQPIPQQAPSPMPNPQDNAFIEGLVKKNTKWSN